MRREDSVKKRRKTLASWYKRSGAAKWARRHRFTETHFEPYTKAIGRVLLAWNDLHEHLATLFVIAMGGGWTNRPLAVWHSVRNDLGKRKLLKAAIEKQLDSEKARRPKFAEEILWIIKEANSLEGFRDDSAHTPLAASGDSTLTIANILTAPDVLLVGAPLVFPHTLTQNPRAERLDQPDKNLLTEYEYARDRIIVLRDYAIAIEAGWDELRLPWPDRPDLPERKPNRQSKGRGSRRKKK